jgi:hypothetical protein
MSKILTLAATGAAGLVLGAGIGVAAAGQEGAPRTPERSGDVTSMDEMHAAMVDQMPAGLAEQCDRMHATMGEHMGAAAMPGDHRDHHPRTEG